MGVALTLAVVACALAFGLGVWVGRKVFARVPPPTLAKAEPPPRAQVTPGAVACADDARRILAGAETRDALVDLGADLSVEAYGRGLVDLRAAIIETGVLPDEIADELCNVAMARMEGR